MRWSTLNKPIRLETLFDARGRLLSLPPADQAQDRWQRAAAMLMTAATTGLHDHITIAEAQLERALTDPTQSSVRLARDASKRPPAPSIGRRGLWRRRRA
jgi:hypothetical protein